MKNNKILLLLILIFSLSCASGSYWKIKIKMPREGLVDIDQFKEIVITNFLIEKETEDLDLNKELTDYLTTEFGRNFKGKITSKKISLEKAENFKQADFWKNLLPDSTGILFLTGSAQYSQEIRKAFLEKRPEGTRRPFFYGKGLAQRNFFTLVLQLYLINAETGEILYDRNFKETKGYKNPNQTAKYAFYDFIEKLWIKFSRNIFGEERLQQRYLISD